MKHLPINRKLAVGITALCICFFVLGASLVWATTPSTTFTISSGVYPGAPSYTIYSVGGTYYAKDQNGMQLISAGTSNVSLLVNSIHIGKIIFENGIYEFSTPIIGDSNLVLDGESMGAFDALTEGAVLKYIGSSSNPFVDFRDARYTCISNLKIVNAGSSTVGIRLGGSVAASTLATKCISVSNIVIDGFSTGILGDVQGIDDSNFNNVFVGNADIGIDHLNSQTKFFGGTIYDSAIGIRVYRGTTSHPDASMQFFGTVWSGCLTTAIDIIGNQTIRALTFTGCWFESVGMILRATGSQAGIYLGSVDFINCNGYPLTTIFDLRGRNINVNWDGGELYPNNSPAYVYTDGAGATAQKVRIIHLVAGSERISFNDINNGLRGIDNDEFIMLNSYLGADSLVTSASWTNTYQNIPCPWTANTTTTCALFVKWTPGSTNAGIRILYGASIIASIEPNSAAYRADAIDISANARTLMDFGGDIIIQCHGNTTVSPIVNLILFLYSQ